MPLHRYTSQCHVLLWGATLKAPGCTAVRWCVRWNELCDLVEIWLFTVRCIVFKWPWPWWDYYKWCWCVGYCSWWSKKNQCRGGPCFKTWQLLWWTAAPCVNLKEGNVCSTHLLSIHVSPLSVSKSLFADVYVAACGLSEGALLKYPLLHFGPCCPLVLSNADTSVSQTETKCTKHN